MLRHFLRPRIDIFQWEPVVLYRVISLMYCNRYVNLRPPTAPWHYSCLGRFIEILLTYSNLAGVSSSPSLHQQNPLVLVRLDLVTDFIPLDIATVASINNVTRDHKTIRLERPNLH